MVILCEILPSSTLEETHGDRKITFKKNSQSLMKDSYITRKENPRE